MVETKGDHPWHYDPEQQDNGYRIWKTHTGGWFRVKEPTPESNSWMEMQIIGQSRPTQSYTESLFPNTTDVWGYYSTSLDFSWEIKIEIWRRTIVHDEITGQDDVGSPVLQSTFPFDHLGNVSIDPNSGKITLSPKPPNILKLVDSGNMGPCEYKVKMIKEPSSFGIYVYVWKSHDGDPVPPGEQPAGGIGLTDFFTWSVKEYMVPQ